MNFKTSFYTVCKYPVSCKKHFKCFEMVLSTFFWCPSSESAVCNIANNSFLILSLLSLQCEECMCWQHSVCMGLLEDSIPDHYICYICRDPPGNNPVRPAGFRSFNLQLFFKWKGSLCTGKYKTEIAPRLLMNYVLFSGQRWSAKYPAMIKTWLQKGHMYGLSLLTENYSHQNAKKIVSTHQLLADVYSVKNLLHGLQLKMDILQ